MKLIKRLLLLYFCLLFFGTIQHKAEATCFDLDGFSVKSSIGYDFLTLGVNYKFAPKYFFQLDINPIFLSGAGIIGQYIFEHERLDIYAGIGAGVSLMRAFYIFPGVGYRFKITPSHAMYIEFATGFYSFLPNFTPEYIDTNPDQINILRLGYQLTFN